MHLPSLMLLANDPRKVGFKINLGDSEKYLKLDAYTAYGNNLQTSADLQSFFLIYYHKIQVYNKPTLMNRGHLY